MNKALRILPSIFFILLAMFWIAESYLSLGIIHYRAVAVVVLLTVQLFIKHTHTGLGYGIVLALFSGYKLVDAVIDQFTTALPTDGTFRFMLIKCTMYGAALLMAIAMFYYYFRIIMNEKRSSTSV